jgi:hypothetical protein
MMVRHEKHQEAMNDMTPTHNTFHYQLIHDLVHTYQEVNVAFAEVQKEDEYQHPLNCPTLM